MRQREIEIISEPAISALYYGLLQCGYSYYSLERDYELIKKIKSFIGYSNMSDFWSGVRRESCEVYPYWPRAYMLEAAAFYIDVNLNYFIDFSEYRKCILDMTNIESKERDEDFWTWINGFPSALSRVMKSSEFLTYFDWEQKWIAEQNELYSQELQILQKNVITCVEKYHTPINHVRVILSPIKCVYSSDYHIFRDSFVITSGRFDLKSILHELLHQVVHPVVLKQQEIIMDSKESVLDLDPSYYLDGSKSGYLNAYEEFFVRQLTDLVLYGAFPDSVDKFVCSYF